MSKELREQFTKETGCDFYQHSHTYIEWLESKLKEAEEQNKEPRGSKKTELQKEFEEQTPTIKGVSKIEYLQTFITWLHLEVEKLRQ